MNACKRRFCKMVVSNSTHLDPEDRIRVEKIFGAHNDFVIHFGFLSKVFIMEDQLKALKAEIDKRLN